MAIALRRRMSHALAISSLASSTTPQAHFARWVAQREWESHRWELVNGRVVRRPPAGQRCTAIARRLQRRLAHAADRSGVVVLEPRQGLELPTGDTLVPDVAVLSAARWAGATPSAGDLLRVVPELVVEVLRERDHRARGETREIYQRAGVEEHWVVDPLLRTVTLLARHRDRLELALVLAGSDVLRPAILPGVQLALAQLF
jgi:Uma2 family endonuclease